MVGINEARKKSPRKAGILTEVARNLLPGLNFLDIAGGCSLGGGSNLSPGFLPQSVEDSTVTGVLASR